MHIKILTQYPSSAEDTPTDFAICATIWNMFLCTTAETYSKFVVVWEVLGCPERSSSSTLSLPSLKF
ncbi:hypothetical protein TNCV_1665661 [Trichonephila clavipes]|nr:hypothetical protein TNCV_1665661 [Trichonephila clavipes]